MTKSNIVGIRFAPKARAVLEFEAGKAKRVLSDFIRVVLEERFPQMSDSPKQNGKKK